MRDSTCIVGSKALTVRDLKKILKRLDDDVEVHVQSHCSRETYNVHSDGVSFNDSVIIIGS